MVEHYLWLVPIGFFVGVYGTLIGAGGGFVLMPALLLIYPGENPEIITSISLAVVFANALSGSWAYARMGRIDYRAGLLFSAATIPGAVIGALTTSYIPRRLFDGLFGVLMVGASLFLAVRPSRERQNRSSVAHHRISRTITEADGAIHRLSYNPYTGVVISVFVGYFSSLLGIGGGIIHVPALVNILDFPVHVATATSHFILAVMSLAGTLVHVFTGTFSHGVHRSVFLAIGVLAGAQLGAHLSSHFRGIWIIRGLAIALMFAGVRIFIMAL